MAGNENGIWERILAIVTLVAVVGGGAAAFGVLRGRLDALDEEVQHLERRLIRIEEYMLDYAVERGYENDGGSHDTGAADPE
jgi:hypothetical protein